MSLKLKKWNPIGHEEALAVGEVMSSGCLSDFLGTWSDQFFGGPQVKNLESEWAEHFRIKHAISMNSATSGLIAAMGAIGLSPGDEVIVSPASMSASATAPLFYGGIPVFADISDATYTLDPESIKRRISSRTKAILVVNLFGQSADLKSILEIARQNNLFVIEDNAQAPGALYQGKPTGTWGDIGVFSLNYHKHIHSGEGGICTTNNPDLAKRLQLIRNHAEAVVEAKGETDLTNLVGMNLRMTEIEAAIARQQLRKLNSIIQEKSRLGNILNHKISDIRGLKTHILSSNSSHVYYVFPLRIIEKELKISRAKFVQRLKAEGVPIAEKYTKPLYQLPIFQNKIAFGKNGYPFSLNPSVQYSKGICPVAEKLYEQELCYIPWCLYDFSENDIIEIAKIIHQVVQ